MQKYLFIAEKPSLMRAVQAVYMKHKTEINKDVGIVDFVALAGHVCRLLEPSEYEKWNEKWKDIDLPMIPEQFKIDTISDKKKIVQDIKKRIKENNYDGIIVGTDADVEGNGIYYLLEHYLGLEKMTALRFFEQDQTDKAILKSFHELTDFHKNPRDIHMTDAYKIRSHMDWLIGMNFTVGFSVKSGFTMKVGRVKAPTLKLVYDNCKAIDEFVPHTDYVAEAVYEDKTNPFRGVYVDESGKEVRFETEEKVNKFLKELSKKATVVSIDKKTTKSNAPQLYKLSDVQAEAGKMYGFTPDKVTNLVQSLYEKKIVSYPRTSGRYISTEKAKEFPILLKAVEAFPSLKPYAEAVTAADMDKVKADKKIVNDAEVKKSSHDALLPTGSIPDLTKLTSDEQSICELIYKRFLAVFLPPLVEEKTVLMTDIDGNAFKTNGKTVKDKGWTVLYKKKLEETIVPDVKKGDVLVVNSFETAEKTTTPPSRLTQPSLIEAMENIQKYIEDKELKNIMKAAKGIGMESSRASIISDLIKTGYIESKGKAMSLYITDMGKKYMENIMDFSVAKPELTAEWESKMQDIQEGSRTFSEVESEMLQYVKDVVKEIEAADIKKEAWKTKNNTGISCPHCGEPVMSGKFGFFCSSKKNGCTFTLPDTVAGKKLTDKNLKDLCEKGRTSKIKGFTSKAGKQFDAVLKLTTTDDGEKKVSKVEFDFNAPDVEKKKTKNEYTCPICGAAIVNDKWAWKCENNCGFALSYKIAERDMKESELKELIEKKKTKKLSGFTAKSGKKFSASLVLKEDGKTQFDFN